MYMSRFIANVVKIKISGELRKSAELNNETELQNLLTVGLKKFHLLFSGFLVWTIS